MPHRIEARRRIPCESRVRACDLSRDGSQLVWADDARKLHLLPMDGDEQPTTFDLEEEVDYLLCLPDNSILVGTISKDCLLYTSPSPRDRQKSRMPSSA